MIKSEENDYQNPPVDGGNPGNRVEESYEHGHDMGYQEPDSQEEALPAGKPMFKKAIRWLIYVGVFLLPLWFLPFTSDVLEFNKQVLLVAVASVGLALYLVDIMRTGFLEVRQTKLYWPMLAFVTAGILSVIFSVNRFVSIFGSGINRSSSLISWAAFAILFYLAVNVIEDKGKNLRDILAVSLSVTFLIGTLQILGFSLFTGTIFSSPSFNTVGSMNGLGILAAASLVIFGMSSNVKSGDRSWMRFVHYAGFILALFIVILINWWVVWTITFVSLLSYVAFNSMELSRRRESDHSHARAKMSLFAMPLAVIVLGIFLMLVNFNIGVLKSKLPIEVAPTHQTSFEISLDSLSSRPLGFGLENFQVAYDKFKPVDIANTVFYQVRFRDATSEIMNLAVEGGALMLLAFISLLWFYGRELLLRIKHGFNSDRATNAVWASSLGLIVAFFLYPFSISTMTVLITLLALIVLSKNVISFSETDEEVESEVRVFNLERDARYSFLGSLVFIVGLVLALVAGYFTVNNYIANAYLAKAAKSADHDVAIDYYVKSININSNDARVYRTLSQRIIVKLSEDIKNGPKEEEGRDQYNVRIQNSMAAAVEVATRATKVAPANAQNWFNRGVIYQNLIGLVSGADQAAINMFNESLARNLADPSAHLRIGNVFLTSAQNLRSIITNPPREQASQLDFTALRRQADEQLELAGESFQKAVSLYNNFGEALYNSAVVYDQQNKLTEATKQFERLQANNQNDPSILFQLGLLYYRNNRKDNAFRAWQQAVLLFPDYSNARWYLSLVYEERGDLKNALVQVEEIKRLNPDNELVQERLEQLRSGERLIPPGNVLDQEPLNQ